MREKKRSLTFFLMALFIIGSLPITNSVSAEDEVDNWPENDAWLHIELISWSANETVEWDNNGGLPDPIFKICIEADGGNLDCINTPTWENQMTLNNSWNYSIDIPDHTNVLNITIECEDNDALNNDECDMNSELDEWKLYAEYNWSATPTLTVSGDGDDDDDEIWKNAASTWKFMIDGFGDEDGDGTPDWEDWCPNTPQGEEINFDGCSSSQIDSDSDGVSDNLDLCPNSVSEVDENGCDLDSDNDGTPDFDDACANTPQGEEINFDGCSSSQIDSDSDGVSDNLDLCPNSLGWAGVDSNGCDLDFDNDGTPDFDDACANTPQGATVDYTGCPMDSDNDGVYDGIDECPSSNNPAPSDMDKSSEVDSTGCFIEVAGSESDSGSAAFGCLGIIVMIGLAVSVVRKVRSPKPEQVFYAQTQSVRSPVHQQFVPTLQVTSRERELENQSRQAQIEAQRLRQELAKQAQLTLQLQSEAAQKQMSDAALAQKQHELAVAQQEKEELEAKLAEAEKNTSIVQNITYNIQDSAISGDITNKINRNDLE
ncbi:MAG: hypothetical protein ACI8T6_001168 [Candidatus Poseidoniaceae archaeon]|jgi:hypothetical protein